MPKPSNRVKLTKGRVESAPVPPAGKETRLFDSELPGFLVRVFPTGRRVYYAYYLAGDGTKRMPKIGVHGPLSVEQARDLARPLLAAAAAGKDPVAEREKKAGTLAEFWPRFQEEKGDGWKPRTAAEMERLWRTMLEPAFGRLPLHSLTRGAVLEFKRANRGRKTSANRSLSLLRSMMATAKRLEVFDGDNPVAGIEFFPEKARETYLQAFQLRAVLQAIDEEESAQADALVARLEAEDRPDERARLEAEIEAVRKQGAKGLRAIDRTGKAEGRGGRGMKEETSRGISSAAASLFRLLIFTGARKSEILASEWSWFDLDRGSLSLPEEASKTGKKVVWLPDPAVEVLRALWERRTQDKWVIEGAIEGRRLVNPWKAWKRVRERAADLLQEWKTKPGAEISESPEELRGVVLHDLRHSFASFAIAAGVPLQVVGKTLGHSQARTTERYAHLADDPVKQAALSIGKQIERIGRQEPAEVVPLVKEG